MSIVASRDREAARRLDIFRRFLTHISECILPDIGFVLWDGSTVPADLPPDALAFIIADEGAVAAMIRRPSVDTSLNLCHGSTSATDLFLTSRRVGPRLAPGH